MRLSTLLLGVSLIAVATPAAAQTAPATSATDASATPTTTLRDALVEAYNTNPDLAGERANLRATDENVPIARSAGLPGVNSTGSVSQGLSNSNSSVITGQPNRQGTLGIDLSVPVFSGGSVRNSVRAAETRVAAGRSVLRGAEADVFTQVVTVYLDVIRDESIVRLNQQNVHALEVNLQATRDRFEVGDLTRTDVAQSEARFAQAQSQLRQAEARLIGSRESYIAVVGSPPGVLASPPALPGLPADAATAEQTALDNNPNLEAAQKAGDATKYDIDVARASRLPKVSVGLGGNYYNYLGSVQSQAGLNTNGFSTTAGVQLSLPLFQGGRPAAQIRQAQARRSSALENVTLVERGVVSQARSSFANYQSALRVIESSKVAVDANRLSLEGVRAENSVGTRTILDILNAEQEFLNSQVLYVTAERDAYVAGFTLLAVMGKAEAQDLGLDGGPLYDPVSNYKKVSHSWSDWGNGGDESTKGTRTNTTPPQNPMVSPGTDPVLARPVDTTRKNP
jgi:outer membrane protein